MKLLSIIIPVYNTEKYLRRCLESLIYQDYKDMELILIDDGSKDSSGEICDEYSTKDDRIKVIHTINQGQSAARNKGLDIANGQYITFVDSDDWVENNVYKSAIEVMAKEQSDVIDFDCKLTKKYEINQFSSNKYKVFNNKEILEEYLEKGIKSKNAPFSPCKKIYLKEMFDGIRFPEGKINEDISTIYKVLMKSKKMIVIDCIGYYYYQSENSTTNGSLKQKDFDLIDACDELCCLTEDEKDGKINYYARVKRARCYFSLLAKIAYYGVDEEIQKIQNCKELEKKLLEELRRNYTLLMKSPINFNRKIIITAFCINFKFSKFIIRVGRKLKE